MLYPASDAKDVATDFQAAYPNATMALIMARAFVASRTLDYLLGHWPGIEPSQVAVSGHSRNGKQSLIFAAFDERVTAVVGSSPGAPIAAPYHFTSSNFYGEGPRTGGATCGGPRWWLCSSMQYAGHPERMPIDGHGVVAMIAPRACVIATAHQDQASDMVFAGEQNIKAASEVYELYGKEANLRNLYRPGQHHGYVDISTYFDWYDKAFGRRSGYADALVSRGTRTGGAELTFYQTYLTPAGFDWGLWNATSAFARTPPPAASPLRDRVDWLLAMDSGGGGGQGQGTGQLGAFSMGATYGEESEGDSCVGPPPPPALACICPPTPPPFCRGWWTSVAFVV